MFQADIRVFFAFLQTRNIERVLLFLIKRRERLRIFYGGCGAPAATPKHAAPASISFRR